MQQTKHKPCQTSKHDFAGSVCVRGAREHNLKNGDVGILRDVLAVFTGVSGAGKSSSLYNTAQQRYLKLVSP